MIVQYFEPSEFNCSLRIWMREIGFSISYGALLLKTWR
jgi:G protein-coupled receptor 158